MRRIMIYIFNRKIHFLLVNYCGIDYILHPELLIFVTFHSLITTFVYFAHSNVNLILKFIFGSVDNFTN